MNNKIMKKATALFFGTLMVFLVSCGAKGNPKTAMYGEFDDISFYEALSNYIDEGLKEANELEGGKSEYEINIEDGWRASEELNENTLNDNEKAITYSAELTLRNNDYGTEKNTMKFFMVLDNEDNTVRARGIYVIEDDGDWIDEQEGSKSEAEMIIAEIYSTY